MPEEPNRRILIIDDSKAIHEDFRKILLPAEVNGAGLDEALPSLFGDAPPPSAPMRFEVDSAYQGQEGLDLIREAAAGGRPYVVAFVDVRMPPGWDGVETITRIWKEFPELNVVVCTAHSDYSWGEITARLGPSDRLFVLKKPFDVAEIRQLAVVISERLQMERELLNHQRRLEELVSERTVELTEANAALQQTNEQLEEQMVQRRQAEESLRASELQYRELVENANSIILRMDVQGRVTFLNSFAQTFFGYPAEEIIGRHVVGTIVPSVESTGRSLAEHLKDLCRHPARYANDINQNMRRDGTRVWVSWANKPIADDDGRIVEILCIGNDITQRKQAEEELAKYREHFEELAEERTAELAETNRQLRAEALERKRAEEAAQRADQAKSEFLANMSHELRTPLHGILSFAAFGIKEADISEPGQLADYFQKIKQSGRVLLELLNDLLDLSKLESGRATLDLQPIDLFDQVLIAVDEFAVAASDREIQIRCAKPESAVPVIADRAKIMQVLRNLLSNAVKFSPEDSDVRIDLTRRERSVVVCVRDQGVGIPEDELDAVFDKFIQSSKTRTGAGGTGLGLAICREIIAAHRGGIWAENRAESGAKLSFELPLPVEEYSRAVLSPTVEAS